MRTDERISKLRSLHDGWLTDTSLAPSEAALAAAAAMLLNADIVPRTDGGIQVEWHRDGLDLEIEIDPNGRLCGFSFNRAS